MKSSATFAKVKTAFEARGLARRELSGTSTEALNASKRAIFALHREDAAGADARLAEASTALAHCAKLLRGFPDLDGEGVFRAALEEYAEARLFAQYVEKGLLGSLEKRLMAPGVYLAGLSDTTGEIVRYALRRATEGDRRAVEHAFRTVEAVIAFLYELDLTGYLRTKFDQAKKNLRALEQMRYDLKMRR